MTSRLIRLVELITLALLCAAAGSAATCTVASSGINFGSTSAFAIPQTAISGTLTITCTGTTGEVVSYGLGASAGFSGGYAAREMPFAGNSSYYLKYNLYTDSAHTQIWGPGGTSPATYIMSGSYTLSSTSAQNQNVTFYAVLPSTNPAGFTAGSYSDSLTLVLTYQTSHVAFGSANVTFTVNPSCTIAAASMAFGNYDPIVTNATTALSATATLNVECTYNYTNTYEYITLSQGNNPGSGSTNASPIRRMTDGSHFLSYGLYTDSGHSTNWNNTTGYSYPGNGSPGTVTVYGSIPAGQNGAAPNPYTDTVVITVSF